MGLTLGNIIDSLSSQLNAGKADPARVKEIIGAISPGNLDLIMRSVEAPQGSPVQVVSIIRDAIIKVQKEIELVKT